MPALFAIAAPRVGRVAAAHADRHRRARNAAQRIASTLRAYVAPTIGLTNDVPSAPAAGASFWTKPRRTIGASDGVTL